MCCVRLELTWRNVISTLCFLVAIKLYVEYMCIRVQSNNYDIPKVYDQPVTQSLPQGTLLKGLPVFDNVAHYNISVYITENTIQPAICYKPAFVLLAINSHTYHFDRRNSIRNTWGNGKEFNEERRDNYTWKTVFIVGRSGVKERDVSVDEEADIYGDIIVLDVKERHHSLTEKTVAGMYWAYKNCKPKYFYKGDDDAWLNKWRMFEYISHIDKSGQKVIQKHWVGYVSRGNRKPIRTNKSKYYVSPTDYKWGRFPPFCSGFGNLMSGYVLEQMIYSIPYIRKIPGIDDVYIGLLAYRIGITPIHNRRFHYRYINANNKNFSGNELDGTLVEHGITKSQKRLTNLAHNAYLRNKKN